MSLWKRVRCNLGHIHNIFSVGELTEPHYCNVAEMMKSQTRHLHKKRPMVECQNNKFTNAPTEKKRMTKQTEELHNDSRLTVVLIGDKVYDLIPSTTWNKASLTSTPPTTRPHVRTLNAIPVRSKDQQIQKNKEDLLMHKLTESQGSKNETPLAKAKKNVASGGTFSDEVNKLLKEKEKAVKAKDQAEVKRIRKALRKLDYRRYQTTNQEE